jgi:squalene synthase HpnC
VAFVSGRLVRAALAPRSTGPAARDDGYEVNARLARDHYENFPVASWLLPRGMRPHVAAVYGFARVADDIADEGDRPPEERRRLLDDWGARLRACVRAPAPEARPGPRDGPEDHLFRALAHTIRTCNLPLAPFEDLLSAFRQDTTTARYDTWSDVLDYCRRSANPVGRLVLRIAGYDDARLDRASDCVCTALQLTNFWQDLDRDWRRGRLYLPRDLRERWQASEADLDARRMTPAWRGALGEAAARTRALFDEGRAVCDGVAGRLRLELRLTWLGGTTILDRLTRGGFEVFGRRPTLRVIDAVPLLWRAFVWRPARAGGR